MNLLLRTGTLFSAVLLAACNVDSPTGTESFSGGAQFAKQPKACVFTTPNGKTHSVPGKSARCDRPFPPSLIGTYVPGVITVIEDGERFDFAAGGGQFQLVLNQDGTTSGYFFAPANPDEEGSGANLDLAGTFTYENGTVVLDTNAESPLDGFAFRFENNTLSGAAVVVPEDPFGLEFLLVKQ